MIVFYQLIPYSYSTLMAPYIFFREKACRLLKMNVAPSAKFNEILKNFSDLQLPHSGIKQEQIIYSVLELVNNSLRAHRELETDLPIKIIINTNSNCLQIVIQDWGGGFDVSKLPYNLFLNHDKIDLNGSSFSVYREQHGYQRFGMGLYLAKRTFHYFELFFHDAAKNRVPWESGKSKGTSIILKRRIYATE